MSAPTYTAQSITPAIDPDSDRARLSGEVVYQVYPRSFQDSNNDGIGDIQGIISRLDYLQSLGVTILWISPIFTSPMVDMGYDIADYQNIDPQFGTLADIDELLDQAARRGIRVLLDLVVNHTSDQHEWFQKALADPQSPYRDYYIFKQGVDGQPPNNWRSIFGGPTWTEVLGEPGTYYFHTFAFEQPDLNWENPQVRSEIYSMINWWLNRGVAGFRVDAITHLKKDLDWESLPADGADGLVNVCLKGQNRPGIDDWLEELAAKTLKPHSAITIGEAYGLAPDDLGRWAGQDGYFSTVFDFSYMNIEVNDPNEWYRGRTSWTVPELSDLLFANQEAMAHVGGILANVLENHDQPRVLSKLVPDEDFQTPAAAKALATLYLFLPGVPVIYQGQELGMKNAKHTSIDEFNDVSSLNNYHRGIELGFSKDEAMDAVNAKSRDNARTPMQWDDSRYAGFSTAEPWLGLGTDREGITVAAEDGDPSSVLNFYRKALALRGDHRELFATGSLERILGMPESVVAYSRSIEGQRGVVLVNLGTHAQTIGVEEIGMARAKAPEVKIVLNTLGDAQYHGEDTLTLAPYQGLVVLTWDK